MSRSTRIIIASSLILAAAGLTACGKSGDGVDSNVVEMNASDGSMNDMTVVESATLDQAGGAMADNGADAGNASNAM